jgi:hypothetical protein
VELPFETLPPTGAPSPRAWWGGLPPSRRRLLRWLFAAGIILVLLVSVLLARFLSVENAERSDELALLQAEVRGDLAGMLTQLEGCRTNPSCLATAKADATNPHLHRSGAVKILQLESPTAYSLSSATGKTRLAWVLIGSLPVVQCVEVHRSGSFLLGIHIHLLSITPPIPGEGKCTKETQLEKEEEEATQVELGAH